MYPNYKFRVEVLGFLAIVLMGIALGGLMNLLA